MNATMSTAIEGVAAPGLRDAEAHALQQYEKIIRFRDEILAGKHATIKIPDSLRDALASLPLNSRNNSSTGKLPAQNNQAFASNVQYAVASSTAPPAPPTIPRSISLTKAQELLRAELQTQRRRIEQKLQEDLEQNRNGKRNGQSAQDGIDPSSILAAALILVPEATFSAQAVEGGGSGSGSGSGNGPENDSFDDNTFYSSQHDTPEFEPAPPGPPSPAAPLASIPPVPPATKPSMSTKTQNERRSGNQQRQLRNYEELAEPAVTRNKPTTVPGLNQFVDNARAAQASAPTTAQTQPSSYIDMHPPSPLLQNNARMPVTQSSHTRDIPGLYGSTSNVSSNSGAPAQIAALRSEPNSRTSPDSSSQGGQSKRKNRRKKRKSDRPALGTQNSFEGGAPHIKAEPRSPSPIGGPSYLRPNKRQRQQDAQVQDSPYDEMTYDPAMPSGPSEAPRQPLYHQRAPPSAYEGTGAYSATGGSTPATGRAPREYVAERVMPDDGYRREYIPQQPVPYEYVRGTHLTRAQQMVVNPELFQDGSISYSNSSQTARYSVHPEGDTFHEPARPQPARILVDAFGREYIEPARQVIRHSMAPSPLQGEAERLYEQGPSQSVSRYRAVGALEERGGYVFAQPSSPSLHGGPRRIITQPEYVAYDSRDGRYREYSARPMAASGEFVPVRAQEHRVYTDSGREYISRASSMHPADQSRTPSGLTPYGHAPSARPEASGVLYGIERSVPAPGIKSYGSWPTPASQGVIEREGGSSMYAPAAAGEATSSRGGAGQDAMYGRGSRPDGFR